MIGALTTKRQIHEIITYIYSSKILDNIYNTHYETEKKDGTKITYKNATYYKK